MRNYILSGFADEIDPALKVQLQVLNQLGVSKIEMRGVDGKNVADLTLTQAQTVRQCLDNAGISVSAIGSPIGKYDIMADFAPHFSLFQHICKLCPILGTTYIRIFSFFMPQGQDAEQYRDAVINRLSQMIAYAKEKGLVLLHENEKDIYGDTAPRCLDLMQTLSCQNFRAIFDFANFVQCEQDTQEALTLLRPYIDYIHIKDATGLQVVPVGMGQGQVKQILKQLYATGFAGVLSLEPHLADFAGFTKLEHADADSSNRLADGKFAWTIALNALKALLYDLEIGG